MNIIAYAVAAIALAAGSSVAAQSIEESYANLCSDEASAKNETCAALREALMTKLAEQRSSTAATPASRQQSNTLADGSAAERWGFFAGLPGGSFYAGGSIFTYSWKDEGRVIDVHSEIGDTHSTITLRNDGMLEWASPEGRWELAEAEDGSFLQSDRAGQWRSRRSMAENGLKIVVDVLKDGRWTTQSETIATRLTPQQLADLRTTMEQARRPENIRARWGVYGQLAGGTWMHERDGKRLIWSYEWVVPGVSLAIRFAGMNGDQMIPPTPKGVAFFLDPVTKKLFMPGKDLQPDGSVLGAQGGNMRTITRSTGPDSYEEVTEELKEGEWEQRQVSRFQRVGGPDIEATFASLTAQAPAPSAGQPVVDEKWGPLLRLVNTTWGVQRVGGLASIDQFTWVEDGAAIKYTGGIEGFFKDQIVFRPGREPGTLSAVITTSFGDEKTAIFRFDDTGILVSDWYRYSGLNLRHEIRSTADGQYESRKVHGENGSRPDFPPLHGYFRRYSDDGIDQMASQSRAVMADINEKVKQDFAAEEARKKASDGGLLGTLIGAGVGLAAGSAAGLDTEQTVGVMMKGMSITNPDSPIAGALSVTGDQLLSGGGATSAVAGGLGGATAGASYPTKPNLATGACSGFTEGNYRAKALEGGGDSQLNTMCGQAFEYYTMYKRAIAQGYSEADANRTYAAHEQSARVASGYLSSHGAN